ncbi:hypothetical protein AYJ57_09150 [Salipiger sp. CCB-MM3]|uniref:hypothetical protein n=1 Tax=Salipiger sp. CCB-MM3 TaxID=1792508 RepID=UPI00080ABCDE|nr:hypothetical protein [Salipiger sp. CCB-MM3]ANT60515.1 hypothetical protein AYJ57_09150 [Salipiger sp. CCB-MM3]
MHVDRVEFDGFEPMERGAAARLCDGTDPDTIGPPGGSVSLVSQDGRLRVSLLGAPQAQRPAPPRNSGCCCACRSFAAVRNG